MKAVGITLDVYWRMGRQNFWRYAARCRNVPLHLVLLSYGELGASWDATALVLCIAPYVFAMDFPEGPFRAAFLKVVNGTDLLSPIIPGYGRDHFPQMKVGVIRDIYNWSGNAVLISAFTKGKSPEKTIRAVLKDGASKGYPPPPLIAVWGGLPAAGFASRIGDNSDVSDIKTPVVEVSESLYSLISSINNETLHMGTLSPITIIFRDDDISALDIWWPFASVLVCGIILTSLGISCVILAVYKLQLHLRYTFGITIPKIYFCIDLLANGMRLWYCCANPFYVNRFAFTWTNICTTTPMALSIICALLLSLKWRDLLLSTQVKATMFLSTFKWPFIIGALIIFIVEFVCSLLRGLWYSLPLFALISRSFLTVAGFIVTALLFISGVQILIQLHRVVGYSRNNWQLNYTTLLILTSGVFLLAWSASQLALILKVFRFANIALVETNVITAFQFGFLLLCSLLQSWAMPIPLIPYASTSVTDYPSAASTSSNHYSEDLLTNKPKDAHAYESETISSVSMEECASSSQSGDAQDPNFNEYQLASIKRKHDTSEDSSRSLGGYAEDDESTADSV